MSDNTREARPIRTLLLAPQPFRIDDLAGDAAAARIDASTVRRPADLAVAIDEITPDVIIVSTAFPDGRGIDAIGEARALTSDASVLALTPDPPPHADVALATRAGAVGFIDAGAGSDELIDAIQTAHDGGDWFPPSQTKTLMTSVAGDLDVTRRERRSRLIGIAVGLVPVTGAIAAVLSLLYRRYLGQIGVRPVDIALDPASRVVDAVSAILSLLGAFGPLLFVGSWLALLSKSPLAQGPLSWLLRRPRTARIVLSVILLGATAFLALGVDLLLVLFIGPLVALAVVARSLELEDELPRILRLESLSPRRAAVGGLVAATLFIAALSFESLVQGPRFDTNGTEGILMPQTVGFNATPMLVLDVDSGDVEELLYLGGNADLYVFVDPCNNDAVTYVSVGATRLRVIDEVAC